MIFMTSVFHRIMIHIADQNIAIFSHRYHDQTLTRHEPIYVATENGIHALQIELLHKAK